MSEPTRDPESSPLDRDAPPDSPAPGPWPPAPESDPDVFWSFSDLFLFAVLFVLSPVAVLLVVSTVLNLLRLHPSPAAKTVGVQLIAYVILFVFLLAVFRLQYGRPLWRSLGWKRFSVSPVWIVLAGAALAYSVAVAGKLLRAPAETRLMELLQDRSSLLLVGIFSVTLGPLAEELEFRGFIQPVLVRRLGAFPGILLTALIFGLLHLPEYNNFWQYGLLICGTGAAFGWMRHVTGSTGASTLMHVAYNALFFAGLWASRYGYGH